MPYEGVRESQVFDMPELDETAGTATAGRVHELRRDDLINGTVQGFHPLDVNQVNSDPAMPYLLPFSTGG